MSSAHPSMPPVAVVGIGALAPGSRSAPELWRTVLAGADMITDVPADHWSVADYYDPDPAARDHTYGRRGAFLDPVDFDPTAYGIPPATVPATDTSQLLALLVADQVLTDAGLAGQPGTDRERVGVILGTAALELLHTMSNRMQRPVWLRALRAGGIPDAQAEQLCDHIAAQYVPWQEATFPGLLSNVVAGRIANRFDLHGINYTTDAACASSLAAISCAMSELALGTADLMITGGVDTLNDIVMYMCFSKTPALSRTGDCRPFSAAADGTMLGEALVMFALKRLADAERDGDRIYAVIRGIGTSSDGRGQAIYAPVPAGQARALRRAYEAAGYGPDTVELVEAHGTGTVAGDAAEFSALRDVFDGPGRADRQWCALGSIKSQIGHTKSAAGAAGLLKAVLSLHHKILPPTIKVERPSPKLDLAASPFYLNTEARPWIRAGDHPRRASVSSFGFGGTNFHLAAEEYVPAAGGVGAPWTRAVPTELVLVSAGSAEELAETAGRLAGAAGPLADRARQSQQDFDPAAPARACLVARDEADLAAQVDRLRRLAPDGPTTLPTGLCLDPRSAAPGRVALLFSGQGSQYIGMGAGLAMYRPEARAAWDRAAGIPFGDRPLHRVVFPEPVFAADERDAQAALLTRTEWAQPALAVQSLAVLEVLRGLGIAPDCVAGHSFGELVALHAAGVFDEADLVRLARRRGELMSEAAAKPGAMLAVGGDAGRDLAGYLDGYEGRVWIANHNSPTQVVLSGEADAIAELAGRLTADGVTARILPASGAFHTPLLDEARAPLARFLDDIEINAPALDVYANADATCYPADPRSIRERIAAHLVTPVRFADQIEAMYTAGVRTFVEVGAGSSLGRLVSDVLGERPHLAVRLDHKGSHGVTALHQGLGRLAVAGVPMRLEALWEPYAPPEPPRPTLRMSYPLSGTNYGRPNPPEPAGHDTQPATAVDAAAVSALPVPVPGPGSAVMSVPAGAGGHVAGPVSGETASLLSGEPAAGSVGSWLHAFEESQRQVAAAHADYQRIMADSHHAFLETTSATLASLVDLASPGAAAAARPAHTDDLPIQLPVSAPASVSAPAFMPAAASMPAAVPMPAPSPIAAPDPSVTAGQREDPVDVADLLYEIVAERTGYPRDILEPHMELEADLGIDSIKRVEILSLLRRRAPEMADVPAEELVRLRTLGQIAERFRSAGPATAEPQSPPGPATPEPQPPPGPALTRPESPAGVAASRDVPPPAGSPRLTRSVTEVVPAPASGLELPGLRGRAVLVLDDGSGVAAPLVERLRRQGVDATTTPNGSDGALILLGGLRPLDSADAAIAVNTWAFRAVREAAPAIAEHGLLVVVQDTGGDFGLGGAPGERAWSGGLAALARTAAREWPTAVVKSVDCERGERTASELAAALAEELLRGGSATDVGLSADGTRRLLRDRAADAVAGPGPAVVGPDSVIVVTGGGRGVTAAALAALAAAYRPTLVLLGRTELADEPPDLPASADERHLKRLLAGRPEPDGKRPGPAEIGARAARILAAREVRATVAGLEAAGSAVRYFPVDTRDPAAVAAVLDRVRAEFGPITGVVHAAGVLADAHLADKTDEQFDAVFGTKVAGLRAVLAATTADPLSLVCVFSSVAGRFGNAGQADYAMANEVVTQAVAAVAARRPECAVRAIAWGPWDGGMVGPELRDHFRSAGVALIPTREGADAFVREVAAGPGAVRVTVVAGDRPDAFGPRAGRVPLGDVLVSAATHPYLSDHAIAGPPVLPMALVLEWFAGVAVLLRDLEVVRGVSLPDLAGGGHLVTVAATGDGERSLSLECDGRIHYRATAAGATTWEPRNWASPVDISVGRTTGIYGGVLFHGPAFHCLAEVSGVGAAGAVARARGVREMGWTPDGGWRTDPAAVDAALQLALLWAEHRFGAAFLPMGAEEIRLSGDGPVAEPARCVVLSREREADPARPLCDVAVLDADGRPRVEMLGVSLVRRPDAPGNGD